MKRSLCVLSMAWAVGCVEADPGTCEAAGDCAAGAVCRNGVCVGGGEGGSGGEAGRREWAVDMRVVDMAEVDAGFDARVREGWVRDHWDDGIPDEWDLGAIERDEDGRPLVTLVLEALDAPRAVVVEEAPLRVAVRFGLQGGPRPMADLPVGFVLAAGAGAMAALERGSGRTDADGVATAWLVIEGPGRYAVETRYPTGVPNLEVTSAPITALAGMPSGDGLTLRCAPRVVAAFLDRAPGEGYTMAPGVGSTVCGLTVADRGGRRIAGVEGVEFMREAGTVDPAGFDAAGQVVTRLTVDAHAPVDVAAAGGRAGVPAGVDGFDPDDGWVRLVAIVPGAEAFVDADADGHYRPGIDRLEPADDLSEPFVDVDDDGAFGFDEIGGVEEAYRDVDGDGLWTPANGAWDGFTALWVSTTVLYTGALSVERSRYALSCVEGCVPAGEAPGACGGAVAVRSGGRAALVMSVTDANGNCVAGAEAVIAAPAAMAVPVEPPVISAPCFDDRDRPGAPAVEVALPVGAVAAVTAGEVATVVRSVDARGEARVHRFAAAVYLVP